MMTQKAKPTLYILPALVLMTVLSLLPNLYSVYLAFTNFSLYHYYDFSFVGLKNFGKIFSANELHTFVRVGVWTVAWAGFSVVSTPKATGRPVTRETVMRPWATASAM